MKEDGETDVFAFISRKEFPSSRLLQMSPQKFFNTRMYSGILSAISDCGIFLVGFTSLEVGEVPLYQININILGPFYVRVCKTKPHCNRESQVCVKVTGLNFYFGTAPLERETDSSIETDDPDSTDS